MPSIIASGVIRPVVSMVKALASALSIGSGASIGREGPIIQIGSSFGSTIGQCSGLARMATHHADRRGSRRRNRRDVQYADRRRAVRHGDRSARSQCQNTGSGGHRNRDRNLYRPAILRTSSSFSIPALETPYFVVAKPIVLVAYVGLGAIAGLGLGAVYMVHLQYARSFSRSTSRAVTTCSTWRECCWSGSSCTP